MERCIIAAVADNGAIGKDNDLLWHIAEDMRYFRRTTTGNPVVMGYRTFLSIGRPLPKRVNIVISTRPWDDVPVESETPAATDPETGYTYEFRVYTRRVFPPLCL